MTQPSDETEHTYNSISDVSADWVQGVQINGKKAEKNAVEIDKDGTIYCFPDHGALSTSDGKIGEPENIGKPKDDYMGFVPDKLPFPGTPEFKHAARNAVDVLNKQLHDEEPMLEIHVPRRYILLPPATLRPTEGYRQAIDYALRLSDDHAKFAELQNIFKAFGYFYPYWIATGGKFVHKSSKDTSFDMDTRNRIRAVVEQQLEWQAFGGDLNRLKKPIDVEGWLESTSKHQALIMPLDINPIYNLLDNSISSEIQRIYKVQYLQAPLPLSDPLLQTSSTTFDTSLLQMRSRIGTAKGVHLGGRLSKEDAVELVNENLFGKLLRDATVAGKPRIECSVRRTMLGSDVSTHAILRTEFPEHSTENMGFVRGAIDSYLSKIGCSVQPTTRGIDYFVMYVIFGELTFDPEIIKVTDKLKEAVQQALAASKDCERYRALQEVFSKFGYYYPSAISLGGRALYKINQNDPPKDWLEKNGIAAINRAFKRNIYVESTRVETIGGSTEFTDCRDWINSVKTNQTRIQFKSMKPIYELFDEDLKSQIRIVYDKCYDYINDFPRLSNGIHFDGVEADQQAVTLTKQDPFSKTLMLKRYANVVSRERIQLYTSTKPSFMKYSSLDIETYDELPGSAGFRAGAEAIYRERSNIGRKAPITPQKPYHTMYITYAELHLYDELIQASDSFKKAIDEALQANAADHGRYYALQNVFQRFGFYYPSTIIFGGRIVRNAGDDIEQERQNDNGPLITEIGENNKAGKEGDSVIASLKASLKEGELWETIGGDGHLLLWHDIDNWIESIQSNQVAIQHKGLKPLYELLDKDQRRQVQQIYEDIILDDDYVAYNYTLETKMRELSQDLLKKCFSDSSSAIEYCRRACSEHGFPVLDDKVTSKVIRIYCSFNSLAQNKRQRYPSVSSKEKEPCQWCLYLFKNDENKWQFDEEESQHSHPLEMPKETGYDEDLIPAMIIKLIPDQVCREGEEASKFVRYGDVVRLKYIQQDDGSVTPGMGLIQASALRVFDGSKPFPKGNSPFDKDTSNKGKDIDFQWKIVACSAFADFSASDESESEYHDNIEVASQHSMPEDLKNILGNHNHVQNNAAILFESLITVDGNKKLYLDGRTGRFSLRLQKYASEPISDTIAWYVRTVNECEILWKLENFDTGKSKEEKEFDTFKKKAENDDPNYQYLVGHSLLYGLRGQMVDRQGAVHYLEKAINQGHHQAHFELAKLWWTTGKYTEAMDLFKRAVYLPVIETCRQLGDIYHAGLLLPQKLGNYNVAKDRKKAFMYYAIGGIFGDSKAALIAGSYLEQGYHEDLGIDYEKALRWYEYVRQKYDGPHAELRIGKLKHLLASKTKDPLEAEKFQKQAYSSFGAAAVSDPSAKFMVAAYHLYGLGGHTKNLALGYQILASLTESGFLPALAGLAECYGKGMGVEQDPEMEAMFLKLSGRKTT
ncbi:hypothetical protein EC973_002405 [Apophysomyces ossiformis]|uniref:MACPF-like domain-containing protein n=1 Tax=Apophysomyces ossiformis TaxID=679940 RepID=A0A8H7BNN4_9FUNG|nr:hypothetical protein EC973_002405 [Apophysomyces ossiformis]